MLNQSRIVRSVTKVTTDRPTELLIFCKGGRIHTCFRQLCRCGRSLLRCIQPSTSTHRKTALALQLTLAQGQRSQDTNTIQQPIYCTCIAANMMRRHSSYHSALLFDTVLDHATHLSAENTTMVLSHMPRCLIRSVTFAIAPSMKFTCQAKVTQYNLRQLSGAVLPPRQTTEVHRADRQTAEKEVDNR